MLFAVENIIRLLILVKFVSVRLVLSPWFLYVFIIGLATFLIHGKVSVLTYVVDICLIPLLVNARIKWNAPLDTILFIPIVIVVSSIIYAQTLSLSELYYPYSDLFTMGSYRNKASIAIALLIIPYIFERKGLFRWVIILVLSSIVVLSFRRSSWVLLILIFATYFVGSWRSALRMIIVTVGGCLLLLGYFGDLITKILAARNSGYMFTLNKKEWRIEEYMIFVNDYLFDMPSSILGNFLIDPSGQNFWGFYGVENSIHVDLIRLFYYFGWLGLAIYVLTLAKYLSRLRGRLLFLLVLCWMVIFCYGGGFLSHTLNCLLLGIYLNYYGKGYFVNY